MSCQARYTIRSSQIDIVLLRSLRSRILHIQRSVNTKTDPEKGGLQRGRQDLKLKPGQDHYVPKLLITMSLALLFSIMRADDLD